MRKHRLVRLVAVLLYIVAALVFVAGLVAGIAFSRNGFGAGWGPGSSAWVLIPIVGAALLGAIFFVVLASMLFFLARIDTNLSQTRKRGFTGRGLAVAPARTAVPAAEAEILPPPTAAPRLPGREEAARIAAEMAALRAAEARQAAEGSSAIPPAASVPPAGAAPAAGSTPPGGSAPPAGNGSA